jgi:hypothetical protein
LQTKGIPRAYLESLVKQFEGLRGISTGGGS